MTFDAMTISTRAFRDATFLLLLLLAPVLPAWAHGGEDHGAAEAVPPPAAGSAAGMLTTFGQTEQFELLLKYPPPKPGEPSPVRIFLADFRTNQPVTGASFDLSFTPAGVKLAAPLRMTSPGVYETSVIFPSDTTYAMVATVNVGARTDFIEARNILAGRAAEHFLADHGGAAPAAARTASDEGTGKGWGFAAAGALIATVVVVALLLRRGRAGARADAREGKHRVVNEAATERDARSSDIASKEETT